MVYGINDASLLTKGFSLDREFLDFARKGELDKRSQKRMQEISQETSRLNKQRSEQAVLEGFSIANQLFKSRKIIKKDHIHVIGLGHVNEMARVYEKIECNVVLIIPLACKYLYE